MTSFSSISFSPVSFDVGQEQNPASTPGKQSRWRAWIAGWAKGLRDFFKIKQREPDPPLVEIPQAQPPKIFHILPSPPTMETKLETVNDKWSVVASTTVPFHEAGIVATEERFESPAPLVYPYILNPLTAPLIQTKVTLPKANKSTTLPPYRVAEGSHIESQTMQMIQPRPPKSKAAAINTLMILLEIERQV